MLKLIYTWTIASIMMILIFMLVIGCETRNPVCSENYCVIGAIFPCSEIGDGQFEELQRVSMKKPLLVYWQVSIRNLLRLPTRLL